ncbi:MAG: PilZ domain-containing protein [Candidatus Omnitrophota bacterium]
MKIEPENGKGFIAGRERRMFERFSSKFPTRFKDSSVDYGGDVFLRDFSASGVRLQTQERFFIDDRLSLEVELPDGKEPVSLNGRVCWSKPRSPSLLEVGMEFHQVKLLQLHRLVKVVTEVAAPVA